MGLYDSSAPGGKRGGTYDSSGHSTKKKSHGFLRNLVSDVKDAAVGIPMGAKQMVTHPVASTVAIGKGTWHDWSPLIHGHAGEWAHNFKEHPLAPILDVATIATLGLGGVARGVSALDKAGEGGGAITRAARMAVKDQKIEVTKGGRTFSRSLSRSKGSAMRQSLVHQLTGRAHPWYNNHTYFEKLDRQEAMSHMAAADYSMRHLVKAGLKLKTTAGLVDIVRHTHEQGHIALRPLEGTDKVPSGFVTYLDPKHIGAKQNKVSKYYSKGVRKDMTPVEIEHLLTSVHERFINPPIALAARDAKGNLLVARRGAIEGYGKEAGQSGLALSHLVSAPTNVWKAAVLGLRPGFFVNNTVGNIIMATLGYGPVALQSWAKALGRDVTRKLRGGERPAWLKYFPEQTAAHMAGTLGEREFGKSRVKRFVRGVSPVTGYVAEQKIREGLLEVELKRSPVVRAMKAKNPGMTWHQAMDKSLAKDHRLADHINRRIDNTMGNYHAYNQFEKGVKAFVPFYGWERAIARHTKNLAADRPLTFDLAAKQGQSGADETQRILGDNIPDFMRGVIPLAGGKLDKEKRTSVLGTQGGNPYASIAQEVGSLGAVIPGMGDVQDAKYDFGSLLGPVPAGVIEQLTGTKASGAPAQFTKHGLVAGTLENMGYSLPETQLLLAAIGKLPPSSSIDKRTGARNQKLYKKDWESVLSSYMGVPVKRYSPQAGAKLVKNKKKKRHG